MIRIDLGPEPPVLRDHESEWTKEYLAWRESGEGPEPRRYAAPEVRLALQEETSAKCAYCEGRVNDVAYDHVEHIKPKSRFPEMVCAWANLTVACPRCNTNKGDFWSDECPLLNPYVDPVEDEIAFFGPMAMPRGGPRSKMTILKLDLNRRELLLTRAEKLRHADELLGLVARAEIGDEPAVLAVLWAEIADLVEEDAEFSLATRHFVEARSRERGLSPPVVPVNDQRGSVAAV